MAPKITERNLAVAIALSLAFGLGIFVIVRLATRGDASGVVPQGASTGASSLPPLVGSRPDGSRAIRVGGATVDNTYPIENFSLHNYPRTFAGSACAILGNTRADTTVRIVGLGAGPSGFFRLSGCAIGPNPQDDNNGYDQIVPCGPGVELPPRAQIPRRGCSLRVEALRPGENPGVLTVVTQTACPSRLGTPCSSIPATLTPSNDSPVSVTVDQPISFTGIGAGTPPTPNPATPIEA